MRVVCLVVLSFALCWFDPLNLRSGAKTVQGGITVNGGNIGIEKDAVMVLFPALTGTVKSVTLVDGRLEVIRLVDTGDVMLVYAPDQDQGIMKVWKDVYVAEDGKIVLKESLPGNYKHAHHVPESWSFEK